MRGLAGVTGVEIVDDAPAAVGPGLWAVRMPVPLPIGFTLCWLVVDHGEALVIDPGWDGAGALDTLVAALEHAGARPGAPVRIVGTHAHRDHQGGAPALAAAVGGRTALHRAELDDHRAAATIRLWRAREERTLDGLGVPAGIRAEARIPDDGVEATLAATTADDILEDGDELEVGARRLRVVHTPGHTPGSICLSEPATGIVFTGDTLLPRITPNVGWADGGPPSPLADYRDSLRRLRSLGATRALPGHEYVFDDPGARAIAILHHHVARAAEVEERLRDGDTAWELATRLSWARDWDSLAAFQRRIAAAETAAHLQMLADQGRMTPAGATWARAVTIS